MNESNSNGSRWWKISLGKGGCLWDQCLEDKIIVVGAWEIEDLGDLKNYPDIQSLKETGIYPLGANQLWDFYQNIQIGDYMIAYSKSSIQGIGVVKGEYRFDTRDKYFAEDNYTRLVDWQVLEPPISIHDDDFLWPVFTRNTTLISLDQTIVEHLKEIFTREGIQVPGIPPLDHTRDNADDNSSESGQGSIGLPNDR